MIFVVPYIDLLFLYRSLVQFNVFSFFSRKSQGEITWFIGSPTINIKLLIIYICKKRECREIDSENVLLLWVRADEIADSLWKYVTIMTLKLFFHVCFHPIFHFVLFSSVYHLTVFYSCLVSVFAADSSTDKNYCTANINYYKATVMNNAYS